MTFYALNINFHNSFIDILCVHFLFVVCSTASITPVDCLERLVLEITYYVSNGTLNTTYSFTGIQQGQQSRNSNISGQLPSCWTDSAHNRFNYRRNSAGTTGPCASVPLIVRGWGQTLSLFEPF